MDVANGERVIKKCVKGSAAAVRVPSAVPSKFTLSTSKSRALKVRCLRINKLRIKEMILTLRNCLKCAPEKFQEFSVELEPMTSAMP